jgi:hypothetical protein
MNPIDYRDYQEKRQDVFDACQEYIAMYDAEPVDRETENQLIADVVALLAAKERLNE